jgi:G3E family GTPase
VTSGTLIESIALNTIVKLRVSLKINYSVRQLALADRIILNKTDLCNDIAPVIAKIRYECVTSVYFREQIYWARTSIAMMRCLSFIN